MILPVEKEPPALATSRWQKRRMNPRVPSPLPASSSLCAAELLSLPIE